MVSLITLSIPIFFALIAIELIAAKVMARKVYRLNDSLDDINCGVISRVRGILTLGIGGLIYIGSFELGRQLGLPELESTSWVTWVVALFGVDFAYYWFHRHSHEVNFLWAAHIVHHQSEDYNLAVALRQSAFQGLFNIWYYAPLALIGVPLGVYATSVSLNTLYQFWIHTRLIGRLPRPIEAVFNTPSHHRVHHGADPKYLDRNYAGVLIIWDRMFGTFQPEEEEPTYGTTKPLARWNPVWANFDYWAQLVRQARTFDTLGDKILIFFKHPGWRPEQPVPDLPEVSGRAQFDADTSFARKLYVFVHFVVMLLATVGLLFGQKALSYPAQVALCVWISISAIALGLAFEHARRTNFRALELARLVALPALLFYLLPASGAASGSTAMAIVAGTGVFSLLSLLALWLTRVPTAEAAPLAA